MADGFYNPSSWNRENKRREKVAAKAHQAYIVRNFFEVAERDGVSYARAWALRGGLSSAKIQSLVNAFMKDPKRVEKLA